VIDLAPGRVELRRWSRGIKPRVLEHSGYEVEHAAATAAATPTATTPAAAANWQSALDLLDRALTEARWRQAEAHIRLSSHCLRLHLLPFSAALATDDERLAFARMELEAVHGERVQHWTLILDDAPVGAATPVCAVDSALLEALRTACTRAALTVGSIRPVFAVALEEHKARRRSRPRAARAPRYGFAFAEAGRVTLALYEGNICRWLTHPRVGSTLAETLGAELQQAQVLGSVSGAGRLQIAFAEQREGLPPRLSGWDIAVAEAGPSDEAGNRAFPLGTLKVARHTSPRRPAPSGLAPLGGGAAGPSRGRLS